MWPSILGAIAVGGIAALLLSSGDDDGVAEEPKPTGPDPDEVPIPTPDAEGAPEPEPEPPPGLGPLEQLEGLANVQLIESGADFVALEVAAIVEGAEVGARSAILFGYHPDWAGFADTMDTVRRSATMHRWRKPGLK